MPDVTQMGQKIRKLRKAKGLNQTEMAKLLEMGQQGYSCYETNVVPMPLAKFLKLCEIFDMSAEEISAIDVHEETPHVTA